MNKPHGNLRPVSGMDLPRYSGIATFMRLPHLPLERAKELDIGLFGLPWDGGTTTRNGSRYGPRQIREMSTLLRSVHPTFGIDPYELANCADLGDAPTNPVDPAKSLKMLEEFVRSVASQGACRSLSAATIWSRCWRCARFAVPTPWGSSISTPTPTCTISTMTIRASPTTRPSGAPSRKS